MTAAVAARSMLEGLRDAAATPFDSSGYARYLRLIAEWFPGSGRSHKNHYEKMADTTATKWPMGCNCEFCASLKAQFITGEA